MRVRSSASGLVFAWVAIAIAGTASADLGAPVVDRVEGPYRIVVFAFPVPLRVGASKWTMFVVDRDGTESVRDVEVSMAFSRHDDGPHADHAHAGSPPAAEFIRGGGSQRIELGAAGRWHVAFAIAGPAKPGMDGAAPPLLVREVFDVQPRLDFWRAHGAAFLAPYAVLVAFGLRRFLGARGRRGPAA